VRELILGSSGVTLADTYTAGGEVLMGTQRWEKEAADRKEHENNSIAAKRDLLRIGTEQAALHARILALQSELGAKRKESELLGQLDAKRKADQARRQKSLRDLRGGDNDNH
jgi:circadian clock protein KaiC